LKGGENMRDKKLIILAIIAAALVAFFVVNQAYAVREVKVDVCHCESNECHTLNIAVPASVAHLEEHEDDYEGACVEITPSPTEEVTPTPEVTPEVSPTATPSATPASGAIDPNSCVVKDCSIHPKPATPTPTTVVPVSAPATGRG